MITLHYYLDTRAVADGEPAPLKLGISKRQRTAYLPTGISLRPSEWDARGQRVVEHPRRKVYNSDLARMKAQAEDFLRPKLYNGELADLTATQIKDLVKGYFYGHTSTVKLADVYRAVLKRKGPSTAVFYRTAWNHLLRWKPEAEQMFVDTFTETMAHAFYDWLLEVYKPNTAVTTVRCLRAVMNDALHKGEVSANPFAGIKTNPARTVGRDLSLAQIRRLWRAEPTTVQEAEALDFFRLSFLLRAINPVDLARVRLSDISNGRLYYTRQKTGKAISVKIEPEAQEIIDRRSDGAFVFASAYARDPRRSVYNRGLQTLCAREGLPKVSLYWARHTLASILFEQGGSMDVVSAILSHSLGGARVTATYVAVREARLDEAMRAAIDAIVL